MAGAEPRLVAAVDLFNRGRYLASHELLDELWEATEGEAADFYKGLIQAAICLHHWQGENPEGARKLYSGHRRVLASYLPTYLELDVAAFLDSMQVALAPLLRARPGEEPAFGASPAPGLEFVGRDA